MLVTDGLITYVKAVKKAFSFSEASNGKSGRPRLIFPQTIFLGQVVKSYSSKGKRYVCHGVHRCLCCFGSFVQIGMALKNSTGGVLNTACIERFNATLRQSIAGFARKSRYLFHKQEIVGRRYIGSEHATTFVQSIVHCLPNCPQLLLWQLGLPIIYGVSKSCWNTKFVLNHGFSKEGGEEVKKHSNSSKNGELFKPRLSGVLPSGGNI